MSLKLQVLVAMSMGAYVVASRPAEAAAAPSHCIVCYSGSSCANLDIFTVCSQYCGTHSGGLCGHLDDPCDGGLGVICAH